MTQLWWWVTHSTMLCTVLLCTSTYGDHIGGFDTDQVWATLMLLWMVGLMWAVGYFAITRGDDE